MLDKLLSAFRNYGNFSGRATRSEFWLFALLFAAVTVAAHFIDARDGEIVKVAAGMGAIELLVFLLLILPLISAGARRLHDSGRSGWWMLFFYIPNIAFVMARDDESARIAAAGAFVIGAIMLLILFLLPGEKGENAFGPDPHDRVAKSG